MVTDTVALKPPLTRDESATLFGRTMSLVALTAGFFALGAYVGRDQSGRVGWLWFLAALACLIALNFTAQRSEAISLGLLFAFGILFGVALAPTISYYASTDAEAVWQAGAATAVFVAGFGAAGYATRRDLSALARWLFWALVALLAFGVVLIFVDIPNGSLIYAIVGLVIFAGLTMFDFQRLRQTRDIRTAPLLAASIFLDALNVFVLLLSIFSGSTE
jgi:FtsH-binding integral membrane protein